MDKIEFCTLFQKNNLPSKAAIEINNTCNLNCIMCNTKLSKRPAGYIKSEIFEKIVKQLHEIGIKNVALHTVGEPLMYKNFNLIFETLKKYKMFVNLSTNGQFPKRLKNILVSYSPLIKKVRFSIDGALSTTYEEIRRGAKFNKLIDSLNIIHKINQNKINYKIPVRIDAVISTKNINEILLFFKTFGKYCWPEFINFHLITGLSPDTSYFYENFPFPNLIKSAVPCSLPFQNIYFTYDGKITLCCRDYDGDLIVGDMSRDSLIEIWNNKNSEYIREQHRNSKILEINACKRCYEPYSFISEIINNYIHFLHDFYPNISNERFSHFILSLLKDLNMILKNKNKTFLKEKVMNYFFR